MKSEKETIYDYAAELKLLAFKEELECTLSLAAEENWNHLQFLTEFPYLNNLMQQGTQVEIESALLKIYPEQGTYSDYNTLPDSLYLYIADENNVVTDAVTDYLGSEVQRGTLSEDNTFNENTYYYFDVTQFMQEELGAFGMYKHNLQLVFNSDDYTGTFKNLTFNDQGGRNPVTLQLIYKVYESY